MNLTLEMPQRELDTGWVAAEVKCSEGGCQSCLPAASSCGSLRESEQHLLWEPGRGHSKLPECSVPLRSGCELGNPVHSDTHTPGCECLLAGAGVCLYNTPALGKVRV